MSDRKTKFTPGPWAVAGVIGARYLNGIGDVVMVRRTDAADNRYVAMCSLDAMGDDFGTSTTEAEREANARLIAAAPDLLAALKGLLKHACIADAAPDDVDEEDRALERNARAAILKAESNS